MGYETQFRHIIYIIHKLHFLIAFCELHVARWVYCPLPIASCYCIIVFSCFLNFRFWTLPLCLVPCALFLVPCVLPLVSCPLCLVPCVLFLVWSLGFLSLSYYLILSRFIRSRFTPLPAVNNTVIFLKLQNQRTCKSYFSCSAFSCYCLPVTTRPTKQPPPLHLLKLQQ